MAPDSANPCSCFHHASGLAGWTRRALVSFSQNSLALGKILDKSLIDPSQQELGNLFLQNCSLGNSASPVGTGRSVASKEPAAEKEHEEALSEERQRYIFCAGSAGDSVSARTDTTRRKHGDAQLCQLLPLPLRTCLLRVVRSPAPLPGHPGLMEHSWK